MLSHQDILKAIPHSLTSVDLENRGDKITGKVRDIYTQGDRRILITTDRVSAFDRVLGAIPFKGQVLNQLSEWWFNQMDDIVNNHMLSVPDPNVMIVQEADPLPIEVIVRGYITGVTSTSIWTLYAAGNRKPYGIELPDGLQKDDPLPNPIITPTTKATDGGHDERLTRQEIIEREIVPEDLYKKVEDAALAVFAHGQEIADKGGLILVDTKYEFGLIDGELALIDEIHTPDSSRYWIRETYATDTGPENLDKEFLRKWFAERGYKGEGEQPEMPDEFIATVAERYIHAYESLTGETFVPGKQPAAQRIQRALAEVER